MRFVCHEPACGKVAKFVLRRADQPACRTPRHLYRDSRAGDTPQDTQAVNVRTKSRGARNFVAALLFHARPGFCVAGSGWKNFLLPALASAGFGSPPTRTIIFKGML